MDALVDSAELNQIALSWLDRGASAFGVWRNGEPTVCWPREGDISGACITAVIGRRGSADELRAYGTYDASAQARLNADAALLDRIVAADAELEAMADDLLESQDQLVALYDLARFGPLLGPAAIVARANHDLYDDFTELDMFATGFVASYNPETRALTFANAGHAPVIFCPAGGEPTMLGASGVPLGILPMTQFESEQITLGVEHRPGRCHRWI